MVWYMLVDKEFHGDKLFCGEVLHQKQRFPGFPGKNSEYSNVFYLHAKNCNFSTTSGIFRGKKINSQSCLILRFQTKVMQYPNETFCEFF